MIIAVASDDGREISSHFGRSAGFVIFAAEDGEIVKADYRPNSSGHNSGDDCNDNQHAIKHNHERFLAILNGCDVVICRGMGRRAIVDLKANGIAVAITTEPVDVTAAAKLYAQGKLQATNESECCKH